MKPNDTQSIHSSIKNVQSMMKSFHSKKSSMIMSSAGSEGNQDLLTTFQEKAPESVYTEGSQGKKPNQMSLTFVPFVSERDSLGRLVSRNIMQTHSVESSKQESKKIRSIKMGSSKISQPFKYRPTLAEAAKSNLIKMKATLHGRSSSLSKQSLQETRPNSLFGSQNDDRNSFTNPHKTSYPPIGIYKPNYEFVRKREPVVRFDHFAKPDPFFDNLKKHQFEAEKARRQDTNDLRSIYIKYYAKKCQVAVMDKKSLKYQVQAQRVDERSIQLMKQYFESNDVQHLKEKYPGFDEARIPKPLGNDKMEDRRAELL